MSETTKVAEMRVMTLKNVDGKLEFAVVDTTDELASMQELVGGSIEFVTGRFEGVPKGVAVVCNENGLLVGLEYTVSLMREMRAFGSREVIGKARIDLCGPIFFVNQKYSDENGWEVCSLTEEQVKHLTAVFNQAGD